MDSENPLERKSQPKTELPVKKIPKRQREADSASTLSPPPKKSQNPQHIINKDYTESENVISSSNKNAIVDNAYENDSMTCEAGEASSTYYKERLESLGKELDSRLPLPDISPCGSEQTMSHSTNSAQVDASLKGPYFRVQTDNSYLELYKGSSTDSLNQDVFQGGCMNQDNSMTESGDLSHDISGTECESLTSSLFLPNDDDAGLMGGLEEKVLMTSKEIPHHKKVGEPVSSCSTSVSGRIKIQDGGKKRKKKKHSSKKTKEKTEVKEASLKSLRPNYFVGIQISNADVSVCLYPLVCNQWHNQIL